MYRYSAKTGNTLNSTYDFCSGFTELNTWDEGYLPEDTDVYHDMADNEVQDMDDTADAEQGIYRAQESEKRSVKRQVNIIVVVTS